ncbi:MAG TPA: T9SS type A sorting domain-containing protein, partial [Rhodothermales bacterium]|nr:T9SS type A sorting domain-containing protein [Rhodothermales bacterium]
VTPTFFGAVDCEAEPGIIIHDDGSPNDGYGANPGGATTALTLVDRFTPTSYPATFTQVCVSFIMNTGGSGTKAYQARVYDDDGAGGSPGTLLGSVDATATGVPASSPGVPIPVVFQTVDLSGLALNIADGSVYIGVRFTPESPNYYVTADQSPDRPVGFAGGYFGPESGGNPPTFFPLQNAFAPYRALFIRAVQGVPVAAEGGPGLPAEVTLYQNAPNPVGSETTIRYALPEAASVDVRVYDVAGRFVCTLVDTEQQPGFHEVSWDAQALAAGVYIVRMQAGTESRTVRVSVVG